MNHENAQSSLNPLSLTIADAVRLLSRAGGQPLTEEMLQHDLKGGAPSNDDGSINLVQYTAWLVRELANGD